MKGAIAFTIFSLTILTCLAQDLEVNLRFIGGPGNDRGEEIIVHSSGDIYVVGTTGGAGTGNSDMMLCKLNSELECIWSKAYGGFSTDNGYSVGECPNGDLVIAGFAIDDGDYDGVVMRIDQNGFILWKTLVGTDSWDFLYKILVNPEGGFICVGESYGAENLNLSGWICRIGDNGEFYDQIFLGGTGSDSFMDAALTGNSDLVLTGYSDQMNDFDLQQMWVVMLTSNLEFQWQYFLPYENSSIGKSVTTTADTILVCGNIQRDFNDMVTLRFDLEGYPFFEKIAEILDDLTIESAVDLGFGFFCIGSQDTYGLGEDDALVQQFKYAGNWMAGPSFGTVWKDELNDAKLADDGFIILAGTAYSETSEHDEEIFLVQWPNDSLQSQFNIVSENVVCIPEFIVGREEISSSNFLYQYLNGILRIEKLSEHFNVSVYDSLGRILYTLENEVAPISIGLPANTGIYFVVINTGEKVYTIKTPVLK